MQFEDQRILINIQGGTGDFKDGMTIFDVDELPTHGGSLRIYVRHKEDLSRPVTDNVTRIHQSELDKGYDSLEVYAEFAERVREIKRQLLGFLIQAKRDNKQVAAYGAPGKGNTLLNYCGIRTDFLDYTVDRSPHKQGRLLPGTRIPVYAPERIFETRPDYVLILPWNLREEIVEQMGGIQAWGGRFVVPIPRVTVLP